MNALVVRKIDIAELETSVAHWSDATTTQSSSRRNDIRHDKEKAVIDFFKFINKSIVEISSADVKTWQLYLESRKLAATTIYTRISHLSGFFRWAMKSRDLGEFLKFNPVNYAHPKAPKPYATRGLKALTKNQVEALLLFMYNQAQSQDLVKKRDYALILLYLNTGMRRNEIISLDGPSLRFDGGYSIILNALLKGGRYRAREVNSEKVYIALNDYLNARNRNKVLSGQEPLWIRHDHDSDKSGSTDLLARKGRDKGESALTPLNSRSFVDNLKRYAKQVNIDHIHLHQLRHTFAEIVADQSGSLSETQDALDHKNRSTTGHYVESVLILRDRYSGYVRDVIEMPGDE